MTFLFGIDSLLPVQFFHIFNYPSLLSERYTFWMNPITSTNYIQIRPVKTPNASGISMGCRIKKAVNSWQQTLRQPVLLLNILYYFWIGHISWLNIIGGATAPQAPPAPWGLWFSTYSRLYGFNVYEHIQEFVFPMFMSLGGDSIGSLLMYLLVVLSPAGIRYFLGEGSLRAQGSISFWVPELPPNP